MDRIKKIIIVMDDDTQMEMTDIWQMTHCVEIESVPGPGVFMENRPTGAKLSMFAHGTPSSAVGNAMEMAAQMVKDPRRIPLA